MARGKYKHSKGVGKDIVASDRKHTALSSNHKTAEQLGIRFPTIYCNENFLTPHYWREVGSIDIGIIFYCTKCKQYLWLPTWFGSAIELGKLMKLLGRDAGYCKFLDLHRDAKVMVAKLQHIHSIRNTNIVEVARKIDRILRAKNYDRLEV